MICAFASTTYCLCLFCDILQVKDVLPVNVTVCDSMDLCSVGSVTVLVTPNATANTNPVISGVNYVPSLTVGGSSVVFNGNYLTKGLPVNASYVNNDGAFRSLCVPVFRLCSDAPTLYFSQVLSTLPITVLHWQGLFQFSAIPSLVMGLS